MRRSDLRRSSRRLAALLGGLGILAGGVLAACTATVAAADGATHAGSSVAATQAGASARTDDRTVHAPSGPALVTTPAPGEAVSAPIDEDQVEAGSDHSDPLADNGLTSPLCSGSTARLSSQARRNCESSSFTAAPEPTGSFGLDVNIDAGPLGVGSGTFFSIVQDLFVTPLWDVLVWAVHAALVMLEWGYSLHLLDGAALGSLARTLQRTQAIFTQPWLAFALAVGSTFVLYDGLVRRRIAETLGEALLATAMMAGGLWVIANPVGTIGVVGGWSDQASLGTLSAVADGEPENAPSRLADRLSEAFATTVRAPWCFLEFGNVRWCEDPEMLDQGLRTVALHAAQGGSEGPVRAARTNGELFLAFPLDGKVRNSFKDRGSLLHAICKAGSVSDCKGKTAPEAEFRSGGGTLARMIGVVGIAAGTFGALATLGFVAIRLLSSSVASLFLLLLAPAAVLAPVAGERGRSLFLTWLTKLLASVASKLLYSFLLGVLFLMQRTLTSMPLGWWTEWLLLSAFWWTAFVKRHQLISLPHTRGSHPSRWGARLGWTAGSMTAGGVRWAKGRAHEPVKETELLTEQRDFPGGSADDLAYTDARWTPDYAGSSEAARRSEAASTSGAPPDGAQPDGRSHQSRGAGGDGQEDAGAFELPPTGSPVLEDARLVAEGKKSYLGYAPPS